jgi:hypothetical protein
MWSTAGWPVSTFRDVASKRTSARAAESQVRTLVESEPGESVPDRQAWGSRPV